MPSHYHVDVEATLHDGTAITASGDGSDTLDVEDGHLAPGTRAHFAVTALDLVSANETYFGEVHGSDDGGSTFQQIGSVEITSTGSWYAAFDNQQDGKILSLLKAVFTLGGTTPSITADVFVTGPTS